MKYLQPTEDFLKKIPNVIYGKVLEGGLGMGIISKKILENKAVKELVTFENDEEVIKNYTKTEGHKIAADFS